MNHKNKSVLVTGANGAMAMETIKHLMQKGVQNITMACRTKEKAEKAKLEILSALSNGFDVNLTAIGGFDMNDPNKIQNAVDNIESSHTFDVVFLAAGFAVFAEDYQYIQWKNKNIEKAIFQNLFGSHVLLSYLKKKDLLAKGVRVLLAGGEGARGIKGMIDKPDFDSAQQFRDYVYGVGEKLPKYDPMNGIGVSKLCGALWTLKISKEYSHEMDVIWFSPGLTSGSAGLKKLPLPKRVMFNVIFKITNWLGMSQTPSQGGKKYAACLLGEIGENGNLLGAPEGKALGAITDQTPMNKAFSKEALIEELWNIIEDLFGPFGA